MAHSFGSPSGSDPPSSNPSVSVLSTNPGCEYFFGNISSRKPNEAQDENSNLDQSWTKELDPLCDSELCDGQLNMEDLLVFPLELEAEGDATAAKSGLDQEEEASAFVSLANDYYYRGGRYSSSIDNWSGALDALASTPQQNSSVLSYYYNSGSASSNQSFVHPSSSIFAGANERRHDDQVPNSVDPSTDTTREWFRPLMVQSGDAGEQRVGKRKGKSTPSVSSKSMSSETDGDEALSSGSNEEARKSELPGRLTEKRSDADLKVPEIGMAFPSHDAAYEFYKKYASQTGFKVRKAKVQRFPDKTLKKRDFYCSKEGFRIRKENRRTAKCPRKETRTGCPARIRVEKQTVDDDEKWVIYVANLAHNHPLENTLQRDIRDPCSNNHKAHSVQTGNEVGGSNMDHRNYLQERKLTNLQPEDCQSLLDYLTHFQAKDPSFFYSVQVDAASRMTNFFWRDSRSRVDYDYFGDVLVLDTGFRVEKYDMICATFLGINHHQQCVLFGCAFLLDVAKDSFVWLFKCFMEAMGGRKPKTLFTNEDQAMADAVKLVLSETQHRLHTKYICQNASKHLSEHYQQDGFKSHFNRCMVGFQSKEEFESMWDSLLKKYRLEENAWVQNLCTLKDKWSHRYAEKTFSAGIDTLQGIENIKEVFKDISSQAMSLLQLVQQCEKFAEETRREELNEDCSCEESVPPMFSRSKIEKQAAEVYTTTTFKMFQKELHGCLSVSVQKESSDGVKSRFKLAEEGNNRDYIATFNASDFTVTCSCGKFESIGILCVHALRVLNWQNIFHIPDQYILRRWRKDAKDRVKMDDHVQPRCSSASELEHRALSIIAKSTAKEDCLKLVETCLAKVAKEVEDLLKIEPGEDLESDYIAAGNANAKMAAKFPSPSVNQKELYIHTKKSQTERKSQKQQTEVECKSLQDVVGHLQALKTVSKDAQQSNVTHQSYKDSYGLKETTLQCVSGPAHFPMVSEPTSPQLEDPTVSALRQRFMKMKCCSFRSSCKKERPPKNNTESSAASASSQVLLFFNMICFKCCTGNAPSRMLISSHHSGDYERMKKK